MIHVNAFLADGASVRESLLNVIGGGINLLQVPELPARVDVDLVVMVTFDDEADLADGAARELVVTIFADNSPDEEVARVGTSMQAQEFDHPEVAAYGLMIADLRDLRVHAAGRYLIHVDVTGQDRFTVPFVISLAEGPPRIS